LSNLTTVDAKSVLRFVLVGLAWLTCFLCQVSSQAVGWADQDQYCIFSWSISRPLCT